jgi:hypothetical protein
MDGTTFLDQIRESAATELDRLGSEKALIAVTDAEIGPEPVLTVTAESEARARDTFEQWADSEANEQARDAFQAVADMEAAHYERVSAELDDPPESPAPDALHEHLRSLEETIPRVAAGMVGRPLVSERTLLQVVNVFVNEGDTASTELARDLRSDTQAQIDDGAALLTDLCTDDADWEQATEHATAVVDLAYEEYADSLASMGLDPKPIC